MRPTRFIALLAVASAGSLQLCDPADLETLGCQGQPRWCDDSSSSSALHFTTDVPSFEEAPSFTVAYSFVGAIRLFAAIPWVWDSLLTNLVKRGAPQGDVFFNLHVNPSYCSFFTRLAAAAADR